jgi:hypothetical protein
MVLHLAVEKPQLSFKDATTLVAFSLSAVNFRFPVMILERD